MKTIAIGDIHGCHKELKVLINGMIKGGNYKPNEDRLIFLGDYVDRGDNSRLTIRYIRYLQKKYNNVIALKGNHEDMLADSVLRGYMLYDRKTLRDYSGFEKQLKNDAKWIDKLPLYFADDFCVFVHGGIDKGLALNKQIDYYMLWAPNNYLDDYRDYDRIIVSGHHAMLNGTLPCIIANTGICIDTGCVFNGKLTAIIMEKGYMRGFCQVKKGAKIMEEIKMNNKTLTIMAQAFYGNRTITTIKADKIDSFILGYIDSSLMDGRDTIDRTVIKVPNTENLVIIYNKYEEDKYREDEDVTKPTVIIPEKDLTLYSRCIACRLNDDDSFTDIEEEDINIINKYFVA